MEKILKNKEYVKGLINVHRFDVETEEKKNSSHTGSLASMGNSKRKLQNQLSNM